MESVISSEGVFIITSTFGEIMNPMILTTAPVTIANA